MRNRKAESIQQITSSYLTEKNRYDQDNVYYNVEFLGQPTQPYQQIQQMIYDTTLNESLINNAENYYMSVIDFAIPLSSVPLMIFPIAPNSGLTNASLLNFNFVVNGAVQPSFVHHGQYFVSGTGNLATTFSLLQQDFAPPNGELVWTVRTNLVNFRQQWFQIFFNILYNVGVNSIRFRITSHEEQ